MPTVERERYCLVQLIDGSTYNFGCIGASATGTGPGDYLVVGPDWNGETPTAIKKVFRSTPPFTFAAFRTQLFNPDDMPNVVKIQAGYKTQPISLGNPPRLPCPRSNSFPPSLPGSRTTSSSISTRPCNSS